MDKSTRMRLLAIILPLIIAIPATLGYVVTTTRYHLTVIEPLVVTPIDSLNLDLYPAMVTTRHVVISNVGAAPINVSWTVKVNPTTSDVTILTDPLSSVVLQGGTNATVTLTITTTPHISGGSYEIDIAWNR